MLYRATTRNEKMSPGIEKAGNRERANCGECKAMRVHRRIGNCLPQFFYDPRQILPVYDGDVSAGAEAKAQNAMISLDE